MYFVREREADGKWSVNGVVRDYLLHIPALMQIPVDGGKATRILDGLVDPPGSFRWNAFLRNPDVSPSGRYVAIASELPDPTKSDVTLKIYDTRRDRLIDPGLSEVAPLGHQDPEWRPDGKKLVYVRNDRDGAKGTPRLYSYDMATEKAKAITGPGYLQPSFSPDGKYIVATKTSAFGTDVVILNATNGAELVRLTDDGASWAPVWSPAGDQIAYLHVVGPARRPAARAARGHRAHVDRQGDARPHVERRPRRRLAARLVRARGPAPGARDARAVHGRGASRPPRRCPPTSSGSPHGPR